MLHKRDPKSKGETAVSEGEHSRKAKGRAQQVEPFFLMAGFR